MYRAHRRCIGLWWMFRYPDEKVNQHYRPQSNLTNRRENKATMPSEVIELSGHLIDSWTLPRAWDIIMDRGGNFSVEEITVGKHKTETSYVRLKVEAPNDEILELIISELQQFGATLLNARDAQTEVVEQDGVL